MPETATDPFDVFQAAYRESARRYPTPFIDREDEGQAHDECTRDAVEAVVVWARAAATTSEETR